MLLAVTLFAVVAAFAAVTLKQYLPQYAVLACLAGSVGVMLMLLPHLTAVISQLQLFAGGLEFFQPEVIVKCTMLTLIGRFGSDVCTDCGQTALAGKVMLAARLFTLSAAMPLIMEIFECIKEILSA